MARKKKRSMWVDNWQDGWRWFSSWAFMLIVFLATTPLPPEILNLLPSEKREYLVAIVAVCGMILRFVKQSDGGKRGYD